MQCKKCGSEWKTNARASLIIRCPFCGAELEQEKEDKLTFQNAKEALRYIVKTYGVDVIIDGIQLRALLDEFIPDLKQERKVFLDAYEQGVCNALYLAHEESEIDRCIAILQSIKVLTTDACMAEKWACYVVESFVHALDWNVPMFGITPNIHMYQMPENINEGGQRLIGAGESGGAWDGTTGTERALRDNFVFSSNGDDEQDVNSRPEPDSGPKVPIFDFFNGNNNQNEGNNIETSVEHSEPEKVANALPEPKPEEPKQEEPQRPVFDFTNEAEQKPEEPKPEEPKQEEHQRPVFDFTDEAEQKPEEPKQEEHKRPIFDFTDEAEQKPEEPKQEEHKRPIFEIGRAHV